MKTLDPFTPEEEGSKDCERGEVVKKQQGYSDLSVIRTNRSFSEDVYISINFERLMG